MAESGERSLPMNASVYPGRAFARGAYPARVQASKGRWDLAFLGVLGYVLIEYTRLPAMFPFLQPLQLGKIAVGLSALGLILSPQRSAPSQGGSSARSPRALVDLALLCFLFISIISACFAEY